MYIFILDYDTFNLIIKNLTIFNSKNLLVTSKIFYNNEDLNLLIRKLISIKSIRDNFYYFKKNNNINQQYNLILNLLNNKYINNPLPIMTIMDKIYIHNIIDSLLYVIYINNNENINIWGRSIKIRLLKILEILYLAGYTLSIKFNNIIYNNINDLIDHINKKYLYFIPIKFVHNIFYNLSINYKKNVISLFIEISFRHFVYNRNNLN